MIDLRLPLVYYSALGSLWCFGLMIFETLALLMGGDGTESNRAFSYFISAVLLAIVALIVGRWIDASIRPTSRLSRTP